MPEAILNATIAIVAERGTNVATSVIAERANVSQGSVFNKFPTKASLLNAAYLAIKADLNDALLSDLPSNGTPSDQFAVMWRRWMRWASENPVANMAAGRLAAFDELTLETKQAAFSFAAPGLMVLDQLRRSGPLADQSIEFVAYLARSIADTTIEFASNAGSDRSAVEAAGLGALLRALGHDEAGRSSD